jgi:hypothetical protein
LNTTETWLYKEEPQETVKSVKFGNRSVIGAFDNSGSTAGQTLRDILDIGEKFGTEYCVLWNSRVEPLCRFTPEFKRGSRSEGWTDPTCIYSNGEFIDKIKDPNSALLMITDGEIGQTEVSKFAQNIHQFAHIPIIMVVVCPCGRLNVSVGTPFFASCQDVLFLQVYEEPKSFNNVGHSAWGTSYEGSSKQKDLIMKVVQAKGIFENFSVDVRLEASDILHLNTNIRSGVIAGSVYIGPHCINIQKMLKAFDIGEGLFFDILSYDRDLLLTCKTRGLLGDLRHWLKTYKQNYTVELDAKKDNLSQREIDIINKIRDLSAGEQTKPLVKEELTELRAELIKERAHKFAEIDVKNVQAKLEKKKESTRKLSKIEGMLAGITDMEKASYSADILGRLSNRAMRAEKVDPNMMSKILDSVDMKGCCLGSCIICMEDDVPMSLIIRQVKPEDVEKNTNDFSINFPLALGGKKHNNVICPDCICYDCAKLLRTSALGRENIEIILPLVKYKENKELWSTLLAKCLTVGLKTSNTTMLFLAIVSHTARKFEWAQKDTRFEYIIKEIVSGAIVMDTLEPFSGTPTLMMGCLGKLAVSDYILKQPVEAVNLLLWLMDKYSIAPRDELDLIMAKKVLWYVVGSFMKDAKASQSADKSWKDRINHILFETRFGVPIVGTAKLARIEDIFGISKGKETTELVSSIGGRFPSQEVLSNILLDLLEVDIEFYTLENLVKRVTALYIQTPTKSSAEFKSETLEKLNNKYRRGLIDAPHTKCVEFVNQYGASVINCSCGYEFLPKSDYNSLDRSSIAQRRRADHFAEVYGVRDVAPSKTSTHYNLHKSMRCVAFDLTEMVTPKKHLSEISDEELASKTIKYMVTIDKRGYISSPFIEYSAMVIIPSFRSAVGHGRVLLPNMESVEQKINYEITGKWTMH